MFDQIVWLLGRPAEVSSVQRNDATPELPTYADNTLAILQYDKAIATVEIAAMEPAPTARRFEVYGTRGSAILDGFDPGRTLRVVLNGACTEQHLPPVSRQELYEREIAAFVTVIGKTRPADHPLEHEVMVQETLLRATGVILPG